MYDTLTRNSLAAARAARPPSTAAKQNHNQLIRLNIFLDRLLERLVKALGGNWDHVLANARPLKIAIEQHKPWLNAGEVTKGIQEILATAPAVGEFPRSFRSDIEAIFRKASPWDAVKDAGRAAVPAGQATQQYEALQKECKAFGLWIVPVGELEGFCKSQGGHGPRWVQAVLEN
jgi:hypothetical protein